MREEDVTGHTDTSRELHGFERPISANETAYRRGLDPNASPQELRLGFFCHLESFGLEHHEVSSPPAEHERERHEHGYVRCVEEDTPTTILHFPTVTIRALENGMAPELAEPFDRQGLVDHPGAQEDPTCLDLP
jgi:hypothetical protein